MLTEIRQHIYQSCNKQNIFLANNVVENLIRKRLEDIGTEMATGKRARWVDWDSLVKQAWVEQEQSRQKFATLAEKLPLDTSGGFNSRDE